MVRPLRIGLTLSLGLLALSACRRAATTTPEDGASTGVEEVEPETVAATGPAVVKAPTYDPSADPKNSQGYDLRAVVDPADPAQAKKKPFGVEALYEVAGVGGPTVSPDGKYVLFTVSHHDLAAGKSNTDLYLLSLDGGKARRMTTSAAFDGSPMWEPDSSAFVFVSSRESGAQLWRMAVDGGEAQMLTEVSTGISEPVLSADGTKVAFVSTVYPDLGADQAANKKRSKAVADNPIQAHVADDLLYRHWTSYADGTRSHVLLLDRDTMQLTDLTPGDFDSPAFSLGDVGLAFSPDGKEVAFVSNRDDNNAQAWTTNKDLYVVSTEVGGKKVPKPRNLTDDNEGFDGHPVYSPDGRYIAFRRQTVAAYESDQFELALLERATGTVTILTEPIDNWVDDMLWASQDRLVFQVTEQGRYPLYTVDAAGTAIEKLPIPSVRGFDLTPDGGVVFGFSRIGMPTELFSLDAGKQKVTRLTGFNDDVVAEYDIRPAEEVFIEGANGQKVHTFIVKPHGFKPGKRYPFILNVHGGPQGMWSDALRGDWQVYPAAGYVLAFANPHGSTGYGQEYTRAISNDYGGKIFEDLMKVVDHMEAEPYVDAERMGAMGWSFGGYMMNWFLGHTDRFKAIASMMGMYDLPSFYGATEELWYPEFDQGGTPWSNAETYEKFSPSNYAKNFKTPTLVVTGELDYRVPYTQSLQLFTALRRQDVPARLVVFPNDGHWPSYVRSMPLYYVAHLDWFHRYLGGNKPELDVMELVYGEAFDDDE